MELEDESDGSLEFEDEESNEEGGQGRRGSADLGQVITTG
jgi:hypothetical protein